MTSIYTHDWTFEEYKTLWTQHEDGKTIGEIASKMGLRESQVQGQLSVVKKAVWLAARGFFVEDSHQVAAKKD